MILLEKITSEEKENQILLAQFLMHFIKSLKEHVTGM